MPSVTGQLVCFFSLGKRSTFLYGKRFCKKSKPGHRSGSILKPGTRVGLGPICKSYAGLLYCMDLNKKLNSKPEQGGFVCIYIYTS